MGHSQSLPLSGIRRLENALLSRGRSMVLLPDYWRYVLLVRVERTSRCSEEEVDKSVTRKATLHATREESTEYICL